MQTWNTQHRWTSYQRETSTYIFLMTVKGVHTLCSVLVLIWLQVQSRKSQIRDVNKWSINELTINEFNQLN